MSELTVRDLGTLFDGPHATPRRIESGPYFLNIASLNGGRLELDQSDHVSETDFQQWTKRVQPTEGDLLFSYETRLGEAALMPAGVRACLGRRMALIRPNRSVVNPKFLLYYYLSPGFQRTIEQHTIHGATVNRISLSTMGAWPIFIPGLEEQLAIAEVLGALDDKIAANTRLAAGATQLALALASTFEPSVPLGEIAAHKRRSVSPHDLGVPRVAHYSLPAYDAVELPHISEPGDIKSSKFLIERPSVLISKLNPRFPRVWNVADVPAIPALASTEFLVLESPFTTTTVLWALLRQEAFGFELESKVAGTSGSHQRVKPADLLATHVADPRLMGPELIEKITTLGESSLNARLENETLAATRDTLLPQLMSGKLRVKDADKVLDNAGV